MANAFEVAAKIKVLLIAGITSRTMREWMQPICVNAIDSRTIELFGAQNVVLRLFASMVNAHLRAYHGLKKINTTISAVGAYQVQWADTSDVEATLKATGVAYHHDRVCEAALNMVSAHCLAERRKKARELAERFVAFESVRESA